MDQSKKKLTFRQSIKKNSQTYLLLAPFFILFFLFTVLPVLTSIIISFTNFNMLQWPKFVGWNNYLRLLLQDEVFIIALKNTIVFSVITGPIGFALCFLFAWVINEMSPRVRAIMTVIFYMPSISGNVYVIFQWVFSGDRYGLANASLLSAGLINKPINYFRDAKYVMPLLITVQLWMSLGVGFLAFIAGLQTVDKTLYESGAVDGVKNRWQELWFITLPSMKPQLMFAAVMTISSSFAVGGISIILAGFPSVQDSGATILTHLTDYGSLRFEMGYASAIATILFVMMVLTNKFIQSILHKVGE